MPDDNLPQYDPHYQSTLEYAEGCRAFTNGWETEANPYPSGPITGNSRYRWFMGWYDTKFGH